MRVRVRSGTVEAGREPQEGREGAILIAGSQVKEKGRANRANVRGTAQGRARTGTSK